MPERVPLADRVEHPDCTRLAVLLLTHDGEAPRVRDLQDRWVARWPGHALRAARGIVGAQVHAARRQLEAAGIVRNDGRRVVVVAPEKLHALVGEPETPTPDPDRLFSLADLVVAAGEAHADVLNALRLSPDADGADDTVDDAEQLLRPSFALAYVMRAAAAVHPEFAKKVTGELRVLWAAPDYGDLVGGMLVEWLSELGIDEDGNPLTSPVAT